MPNFTAALAAAPGRPGQPAGRCWRLLLVDYESLRGVRAVIVGTGGGAVARRRARDGVHAGRAEVQGVQAGQLRGLAPGALALAGHEGMGVTSLADGDLVVPAGRAVAR